MREKSNQEPNLIEEEKKMEVLKHQWDEVLGEIAKKFGDLPSEHGEYFLEEKSREKIKFTPQFLILLGAAGTGKTTVGDQLQKQGIEKLPIISTRPPLPGEQDGIDYFFMSQEEFSQKEEQGEIINPVKKTENWRGILKDAFMKRIQSSNPFFLDSKRVSPADFATNPETANLKPLTIFLLPPSFNELIRRLKQRTTEMEQKGELAQEIAGSQHIEEWIEDSIKMLRKTADYIDFYLVNDQVERVIEEIKNRFK